MAILTPRWTPIVERGNGNGPLSGERKAYFDEIQKLNLPDYPVRRVLAPCGRRSLKTELPKRALVLALLDPKPWADPRYIAAGPTRDQIKNIAWKDLKALVPKDWLAKEGIKETELRIVTWWGAEIKLVGLDRPERIEGSPIDGIWLTERANIPSGAYDAHISLALADRRGWLVEEGTPDFEGPSAKEYEDAYERSRSGDPEIKAFRWSSRAVLPPEEIRSQEQSLDPLYFEQEVEGAFVRTPDMAYYNFSHDSKTGNVAHVEYQSGKTIYVGCDFNFGYHKWALFQLGDVVNNIPEVHVFDLIELRNAEVEQMCNALKDKLRDLGHSEQGVVISGDYSGNQRKAEATASAWAQIRNRFQNSEIKVREQPPIADRLRIVNSFIKSADGTRRLKVHPERCKSLITDFRYVTRSQLFAQQDKGGELTQASDALGYMLRELARSESWFT